MERFIFNRFFEMLMRYFSGKKVVWFGDNDLDEGIDLRKIFKV